ncbi:hypothetical protein ACN4GJ_31385, partial [Burkholderia pseudomallei]
VSVFALFAFSTFGNFGVFFEIVVAAHDSGRGGGVKGGGKGGGTDDHGHRVDKGYKGGEGNAADGAGRRRNGGAR